MLGLIPMKRFGTLDEIAGWVAVLASDVADFMTGAISLLTAGNVSIDANFFRKTTGQNHLTGCFFWCGGALWRKAHSPMKHSL